ncbi:hypothetical protein [Microcella alkaliphila]|uniref:Arsenite efflux pump ACR3-like permease n=1 Tax=Microcella alkaliphila TaxID=279828 RepID=A0A0U5BLK4_9MICO|nr:hypothetical protein [Microcella alkaliphila]BAU31046.1 arsenite efflux pump ACR3-like permease [Microcella alkaliphila]
MVFLIAAAQVGAVRDALQVLPVVVLAAVVFLVLAAALAKLTAVTLRLPAVQGCTLAFSFGTRNSFVVLPLALSLPAGWEIAAIVIVIQSLVELLGMVAYFVARAPVAVPRSECPGAAWINAGRYKRTHCVRSASPADGGVRCDPDHPRQNGHSRGELEQL